MGLESDKRNQRSLSCLIRVASFQSYVRVKAYHLGYFNIRNFHSRLSSLDLSIDLETGSYIIQLEGFVPNDDFTRIIYFLPASF